LRRVYLRQAVEKGIAQEAKSIFFLAGFPPLGNTGKPSKLQHDSLEEEEIEEILSVVEYIRQPREGSLT
jgi:hypothetical protein